MSIGKWVSGCRSHLMPHINQLKQSTRKWKYIHLVSILAVCLIAATLGLFGKEAAIPIGKLLVGNAADVQAMTTAGWKTGCWIVASLGAINWFASRSFREHTVSLGRAQLLNAQLTNLQVDIDNSVSVDIVSREYQKLNQTYPEFAGFFEVRTTGATH
jgi:hypothetical protein